MVQYYRYMWARHSEMLAPLTDLVGECRETKTIRMNKTKKRPWQWNPIHQQVFHNVKSAIAKETGLAYPDFLKPFEIYTNASSTQLKAVITQDNRPIVSFRRKLVVPGPGIVLSVFRGYGSPQYIWSCTLMPDESRSRTYLLGVLNRSTPYITIGKRFNKSSNSDASLNQSVASFLCRILTYPNCLCMNSYLESGVNPTNSCGWSHLLLIQALHTLLKECYLEETSVSWEHKWCQHLP